MCYSENGVMYMSVGKDIKLVRQQKGMTQAQLAVAIGTTSQNISQYERGVRNPKIETLQKIAAALGEDVTAFIPTQRENPKEYAKLEPYLTDAQKSFLAELDEELLQDLIDEAEDEWFEQKHRLNVAFYKLNESGREKALERIEELAEIPKYQDLAQIKIIEETEAQTQALEDRMKENEARAYEKLKRSWENSHLAPPAGDSTQSAGTGDEKDPE